MCARVRSAALVLLLVLAPAAAAEVKIASRDRVRNRPPGCCAWCALETLARHLKVRALYGVTEDNPTRAQPEDLEDMLIDEDLPYRIQYPGRYRTRILRHAIDDDLGAAVGFRELFPGAGGHVVTLVDFGPKRVKFIDPSDIRHVRTMTLDRFYYWWDGFALVLERPRTRRAGD